MAVLVSIIVPIYKVEKFLNECIESIISQTYANIEVILVDDGSPDGSGIIADEWQKKDSRVKVIHKTNGGISSARNAGIKIAKGDYIFFVDSDDYIAPDCIEKLLEAVEEENADISSCKFYSFWQDACIIESRLPNERTIITPEVYLERIYIYGLYTVVWNKLYKRHLFEDTLFEEGRLNEDAIIIAKLMTRVNKIVHLSEALYYYRQRKSGIMQGQKRDVIAASEIRWITDNIEEYSNDGREHLCKLAQKLYFNKMLEYNTLVSKQYRKEMKRKLLELKKELIKYPRFSFLTKTKIFVTAYIPGVYGRIYQSRISKEADYIRFE